MTGVYRESALPAPARTRVAFGTGERLVLHLPISPAEAAAKLAPLVRPAGRRWRGGAQQPFVGIVTETMIAIAPVSWYGFGLSVSGSLAPAAEGSVLRVTVRLGPLPLVSLIMAAAMVAVARREPAAELIFVAIAAGFVALGGIIASFVALRVGIARVESTLLTALGAPELFGRDDEAKPLGAEAPPTLDEVHRKLEAWERKHLE